MLERYSKIILGILLSTLLLYWCLSKIDFSLLWLQIQQIRLGYFILAMLPALCIVALNSLQLKLFLDDFYAVSYARMLRVVAIFSMMVNVVPYYGGHAMMLYLLGEKEKIGKTQTLSLLTLDQITEGFAKLFVFILGAWLFPIPVWLKQGMLSLVLVVISVYLVLVFWAFRYRSVDLSASLDNNWKGKLKKILVMWSYHLKVLRHARLTLLCILLAILMKCVEAVAIYFVQQSFTTGLGFGHALFLVMVLSVSTALPITPGRIGLYEASGMVVYQNFGIASETALAMGFLIHVAHTMPFVVVGYLSFVAEGFRKEKVITPIN